MPLATMRQMIEIGETEAHLNETEWSTISNCLWNFDSGNGYDSNRNSISMWRYNEQDRFVMKISGYKEKILMYQ